MLQEAVIRNTIISKALTATCQPLGLFGNDISELEGSWEREVNLPVNPREEDLIPEYDTAQAHCSISHSDTAVFEPFFGFEKYKLQMEC